MRLGARLSRFERRTPRPGTMVAEDETARARRLHVGVAHHGPCSRARGRRATVLIRQAIDGYLLGLEASRASPSTIRLYRGMLARVAAFAEARGRPRLAQLTLEVVRGAVVDVLREPGHERRHGPNWKGGESTAYAMVCAVRAFSAALRADRVAIADFSSLQLPAVPRRIQPRVWAEEFNALETQLLERLRTQRVPRFLVARDLAILSLLADTGLRAAELCGLNVEDLDLDRGWLEVRGKGNRADALCIRDPDPDEPEGGPTIRSLRDYLAERARLFGRTSSQPALWLSRRGDRLSTGSLCAMLARLCQQAGIRGNRPPHAFRRGSFSSAYAERPTALPILVARMRWSPKSHTMVETYTRGAEIDLARGQAVPLVSKRWRQEARAQRPGPLVATDTLGPPRAVDDAPPPPIGRRDGERAAGQPTRGRRA
jgi:site-specific recombinase XerD